MKISVIGIMNINCLSNYYKENVFSIAIVIGNCSYYIIDIIKLYNVNIVNYDSSRISFLAKKNYNFF